MKKDKNPSADAGELRRRAEARLQAGTPEEAPARAEADTQRLVHELQVHQIELQMQKEELRQSRAEVEAGLECYTGLYDFAPVGYLTLGRDGAIRQVNLTGARLMGVDRGRLPGRRFGVFVVDPYRAAFTAFLEKVFAGQEKEVCEVALLKEGKGQLNLHLTAEVSLDGQECRVMMEDITERKQIEDAYLFLLQCGWSGSGEDFFQSLARYLAKTLGMDYVCIDHLEGEGLTAKTVAVYYDGKFEDNLVYALKDTPCGDVVGKTICSFPKNVRQLFPRDVALQEMMAESYVGTTLWGSRGQPIGLIAVIGRRPQTNLKLAEAILKVVAIRAAGELERREAEEALKKAHDELDRRVQERTAELVEANAQLAQQIEERLRVEAALQLERNKFKSILEAMADGVYIANRQHEIEYVNPVIEKEFGPVNGRRCYEYFHERTEVCSWCRHQEVFAGQSVQWEWHSSKSGKTFESFNAPFPNADGSISRLEILHDVTRRKKAEEALLESEIKHRIVADNTYDWEWWRDPEGNFIYNSPSCKRVTQREIEEFAADPDLLYKIIHPEDQSSFRTHKEEVEQKGSAGEIEFRILLPDGSLRWLAHVCQPVFDEKGVLLGRRGSNRDITARKSAEEQLQRSERQLRYLSAQLLAAQETERSRISRELHDELGGALAFLKLRFSRVGKSLYPDQTALREECGQNLNYIDQIIDDVHRISRDLSPSILEDLGFTAALKWLVDNFAKYHHAETKAEIENVDHLLQREDKITIYRILQEAFTNIRKHAKATNVSMKVKKNENKIFFFVEDEGRGFDEQRAARQGSAERGLGLAIMQERARMVGGALDLWSEEGKGTRITLSIPIKEKGDV